MCFSYNNIISKMSKTSSFVPCITWIRRGVAKTHPKQLVVTQEELKKIIDETKEELQEMGIETSSTTPGPSTSGNEPMDTESSETADIYNKYGFDDYEDSDEEADAQNNLFPNIAGLAYYPNNDEDPYITLKGNDDESDDEDSEIKPDDNILAIARVKENENILEFFVYNEANDDLYIHHDILLTHFPLCVEWLDHKPLDGERGNYIAMGGMEPFIEIWDVDVLNALEPLCILGQKKSKKKSEKIKKSMGHKDAVLDLSWNENLRNMLASASADHTVALWDLQSGTVVKKLKRHTDKVQTIAWHPKESQTLLSGSFDKTAVVYDCRNPEEINRAWKVNGEVERVLWNSFTPNTFFMSTDQGFVYLADMRNDKVLFTLSAHSAACTGLALSSQIPDLLVTTSSDNTAKVWDIANNSPKMVHEQDLKMGDIHCVAACPDAPLIFAAGCQKDMKLWNWNNTKIVAQQFQNRGTSKDKGKGKKGTSSN